MKIEEITKGQLVKSTRDPSETGPVIRITSHKWVHVLINGQKRRFLPYQLEEA